MYAFCAVYDVGTVTTEIKKWTVDRQTKKCDGNKSFFYTWYTNFKTKAILCSFLIGVSKFEKVHK